MKLSSAVACAIGVSSSLAYVLIPMKGQVGEHPIPRYNLKPRADPYFQLTLSNQMVFYQIEVGLGTPSQNTVYTIDTGSSDVWIGTNTNPYCTTDTDSIEQGTGVNCTGPQVFNPDDSSSWKQNSSNSDPNFYIRYGDGTVAEGQWGTDVMDIGGNKLQGANFAIASQTNASTSVFGIGLQGTESTFQNPYVNENYIYDNVPIQLVQQGFIKSRAYSIWLNDVDALEGNILFGGVDHSKYSGTLGLVPLVKLVPREVGISQNDPVRLSVMLHGLEIYGDDSSKGQQIVECSFPVLLDSGSTINYLPSSIIDAAGRSLGAQVNRRLGAYILPCQVSGGLTFDFSGVKISAPMRSLTQALFDNSGNPAVDDNGNEICALAIQPSDDSPLLGDAFLRAAYVVFDLDNQQVALANTKYNVSDSNIDEISSSIPSASSAPSYSSTTRSASISTSIVTGLVSIGSETEQFTSFRLSETETFSQLLGGGGSTGATGGLDGSGTGTGSGSSSSATATSSAGRSPQSSGSSSSSRSGSNNAPAGVRAPLLSVGFVGVLLAALI